MIFASLFAASLSAGAMPSHAEHRVTLEHAGAPVEAHYRPIVEVKTRQVGMSAPGGRQGSQRCLWTATISVERGIANPAGGGRLARTLPETREVNRSRPGSCVAARKAIREEVAALTNDVKGHVVALAENDRASLMSDIAATHAIARD